MFTLDAFYFHDPSTRRTHEELLSPINFGSCAFCLLSFCFQIELDKIVTHRNNIYERLSQPVVTLDELNSAFQLLQELGDMENTIDDIYLPVENMYGKLRYLK